MLGGSDGYLSALWSLEQARANLEEVFRSRWRHQRAEGEHVRGGGGSTTALTDHHRRIHPTGTEDDAADLRTDRPSHVHTQASLRGSISSDVLTTIRSLVLSIEPPPAATAAATVAASPQAGRPQDDQPDDCCPAGRMATGMERARARFHLWGDDSFRQVGRRPDPMGTTHRLGRGAAAVEHHEWRIKARVFVRWIELTLQVRHGAEEDDKVEREEEEEEEKEEDKSDSSSSFSPARVDVGVHVDVERDHHTRSVDYKLCSDSDTDDEDSSDFIAWLKKSRRR